MKRIKFLALIAFVFLIFNGCAITVEQWQDEWERGNSGLFCSTVPKPDISSENVMHVEYLTKNGSSEFKQVAIRIKRENPYCRVALYRDGIKIIDIGDVVYMDNPHGYYIIDSNAQVGVTYTYQASCVLPGNGESRPAREGAKSDPIQVTVQ